MNVKTGRINRTLLNQERNLSIPGTVIVCSRNQKRHYEFCTFTAIRSNQIFNMQSVSIDYCVLKVIKVRQATL